MITGSLLLGWADPGSSEGGWQGGWRAWVLTLSLSSCSVLSSPVRSFFLSHWLLSSCVCQAVGAEKAAELAEAREGLPELVMARLSPAGCGSSSQGWAVWRASQGQAG